MFQWNWKNNWRNVNVEERQMDCWRKITTVCFLFFFLLVFHDIIWISPNVLPPIFTYIVRGRHLFYSSRGLNHSTNIFTVLPVEQQCGKMASDMNVHMKQMLQSKKKKNDTSWHLLMVAKCRLLVMHFCSVDSDMCQKPHSVHKLSNCEIFIADENV